MSIDACNALPVTHIRYEDGTPAIVSWWMPTEQERALIAYGHPIMLTLLSNTHPPVKIEVDGFPL